MNYPGNIGLMNPTFLVVVVGMVVMDVVFIFVVVWEAVGVMAATTATASVEHHGVQPTGFMDIVLEPSCSIP